DDLDRIVLLEAAAFNGIHAVRPHQREMRSNESFQLIFELFEKRQQVRVGEAATEEQHRLAGEDVGKKNLERAVAVHRLAIIGLSEDDGLRTPQVTVDFDDRKLAIPHGKLLATIIALR